MLGDPLLSNYSVLMLDEVLLPSSQAEDAPDAPVPLSQVHERTAQIDIIMGLLKKILKRRRDLKLVISSATVDAEYIRSMSTVCCPLGCSRSDTYMEFGLV